MPDHDLDAFFARHIPLTQAMGVRLDRYDDAGLALRAPLAPNTNDKGTAFAGALASIITLSGWSLTHLTLLDAGEHAQVVIAHSELDYLRPVSGDIVAVCARPAADAVAAFVDAFRRKGRARWELEAVIHAAEAPAVRLRGRYVAWRAA
ncbi:thioesterase domain-containing protein [Plasticicumulans lactativorans]|uniref:Thioesterase domain-containing protein n=1 Tax=Plasticicumulans lactativorans TaxID=1133106 RepID=A0A4R2LME9_9GAMM|nr:YiiD C-terminal domain-containing protein [Plasticicumulans lactativorans]TCO80625.1 thioesterase domain-containing protein [Plasticicumulans lactativorans]